MVFVKNNSLVKFFILSIKTLTNEFIHLSIKFKLNNKKIMKAR